MLEIKYLTKTYKKIDAVKDLNLTIGDGEIRILVGPNGAGKSTTIKCISGLLKYVGNITIDGHPNKSIEGKKIFSYVPELPGLFPLLTVREHIHFMARAYGLDDYEDYANELFSIFDLSDKTEKFGSELSKGMQQKLSICCALITKPKLLIFTSPMKPQNVLLYGFLKEISSIFAMSIFLIFQLPNLSFKFSFVPGGIVYLLLIIMAFFIVLSSLSLLIYGFFSKYYKYKELAIKIVKYSSIVITLALAVYIYTGSNGDHYDFAMDFFNKDWWSYIPVMGWGRALLSQCLTGFNISSLIYGGLLIFSCIGSITLLYKFNLDFYEDALPSAEQNEVAQSYKNSGFDSKQLSKMQNSRKPFARRKVTLAYSAKFAKAIFFRHMLEYKKTGFYFINILSGIYLVASVVVGLYFDIPFFALLLFSIYMMVLSTYAGKWSMDFNGHFIFLIPASSAAKLFYSTLSTILKVTVDSLILFIPAGILMGVSPLEIILIILAYISFGALSTYGAVLNYKLFDRVSNQMMKGIFMMITLIYNFYSLQMA